MGEDGHDCGYARQERAGIHMTHAGLNQTQADALAAGEREQGSGCQGPAAGLWGGGVRSGGYLMVAMSLSEEDWRREAAERPNWAGSYMASMRVWGAMTLPAATMRARYWHWKDPGVAQ